MVGRWVILFFLNKGGQANLWLIFHIQLKITDAQFPLISVKDLFSWNLRVLEKDLILFKRRRIIWDSDLRIQMTNLLNFQTRVLMLSKAQA